MSSMCLLFFLAIQWRCGRFVRGFSRLLANASKKLAASNVGVRHNIFADTPFSRQLKGIFWSRSLVGPMTFAIAQQLLGANHACD